MDPISYEDAVRRARQSAPQIIDLTATSAAAKRRKWIGLAVVIVCIALVLTLGTLADAAGF